MSKNIYSSKLWYLPPKNKNKIIKEGRVSSVTNYLLKCNKNNNIVHYYNKEFAS